MLKMLNVKEKTKIPCQNIYMPKMPKCQKCQKRKYEKILRIVVIETQLHA